MKTRAMIIALATMLVGCDHATKRWAAGALRGGGPIELLPGAFDLRYAENTGVAFSLLGDWPAVWREPLILLAASAGVALLLALWLWGRRSLAQQLAFGAMLAGAVGNLIDRLCHGYVVDFMHLHHWPVFNVADVAIVAGALGFGYAQWRAARDGPLSDGP